MGGGYWLPAEFWCAPRAFMTISRIAATAARQTSASSNGLPRSRSATACRYMSRRARGTWCAWVMTWSSCASVNAIGAIGLAFNNGGIGGGLRELADRLGTAAALGIPLLDECGRDPGPPVLRPLRRLAPEPAIASAVAEIRLIGPLVFLSPLRYELGKLRFGQFRHLKQRDALITEIA